MRAVFGVLSLLVVLAIVASLAKNNLQASGIGSLDARQAQAASQTAAGGIPGATAADVSGLTVPEQSKALQDKVRDDTVRALQQGAERTKQRADEN